MSSKFVYANLLTCPELDFEGPGVGKRVKKSKNGFQKKQKNGVGGSYVLHVVVHIAQIKKPWQ